MSVPRAARSATPCRQPAGSAVAPPRAAGASTGLARGALVALAVCAGVATASGTLTYCYPATLGSLRGGLLVLHEISGDAALLFSGLYLAAHLPRVWSMQRRRLSRWSGFAGTGLWAVAALTGVYGQLVPIAGTSAVWHVHVWSSLAAVLAVAGHGAWGLRYAAGRRQPPVSIHDTLHPDPIRSTR